MPFRSPLFRKLLVSAFALIAITILILDFYVTRHVASREALAVEQQLAAVARVLAGELPGADHGLAEAWTREAEQRSQARVTLIAPDGVVIADSQHDPETMESHRGRPEVLQALKGRTGIAFRHSATLDRELCYVAIPVTYHGQPGHVLRLAVPLKGLSDDIAAVRRGFCKPPAWRPPRPW